MFRGLSELGVDVHAVNLEAELEKEWYYRWFSPDVVLGVGFWGHTPQIILHPQQFGARAVPWLVADGYIANYQPVLNALPLILVTSTWVKEMYVRDGVRGDNIEVLPVGCDTAAFAPRERNDARIVAVRERLGISEEELMILTVGGDAASKGGQEVMRALALLGRDAPPYKYVCKVWPQPRTTKQTALDMELATELGIERRVVYSGSRTSREFMPYLVAACDIYAGPSRLEGFGMVQVEANACERPVIAIDAMAFRDTMVHGETALLASVGEEITTDEAIVGPAQGFPEGHRLTFPFQRTVDYRASVPSVAAHLATLMLDAGARQRLGRAGRRRAVERYDYRVVAKQFVRIMRDRLGIE